MPLGVFHISTDRSELLEGRKFQTILKKVFHISTGKRLLKPTLVTAKLAFEKLKPALVTAKLAV